MTFFCLNLYYGWAISPMCDLHRGHPRTESENDQDLVRLRNQIDEYFVGSSGMDFWLKLKPMTFFLVETKADDLFFA